MIQLSIILSSVPFQQFFKFDFDQNKNTFKISFRSFCSKKKLDFPFFVHSSTKITQFPFFSVQKTVLVEGKLGEQNDG